LVLAGYPLRRSAKKLPEFLYITQTISPFARGRPLEASGSKAGPLAKAEAVRYGAKFQKSAVARSGSKN
jgi:hypothetical protein